MKKLFTSIILLGSTLFLYAQKPLPVTITDYKVSKSGQTVTTTITLESSKRSRGSYRITAEPVLSKGSKSLTMPEVVFRTTKGRILDFRNRITYPSNAIIAKRGETVEYSYEFPYKLWMNQSQLLVQLQSKGCSKTISLPMYLVAQNLALQPDTAYVVRPLLAYQTPAIVPKSRIEEGSAFLAFPVGSWRLMGDFKNNAYELGKINNSIEIVTSDRGNKRLQGIDLWGTSSPEGSFELNSKLSQNRALSVKDYIAQNYPGATTNYKVTSTAEDWTGLINALQNNPSPWAQQVIEIAKSDVPDDSKDKLVKAIDNGITYRYLLDEIYPKLRRVDYKVRYLIRDFTETEVAAIFNSRPEDLSLAELYNLAMRYPHNSVQFNNIMRSSATLYPQDNTALLNCATSAIESGNLDGVAQFLNRVTTGSKEYYNTLGVLQMIKGDYNNAAANLNKAYQMGLTAAGANLEQLKLKLQNIELLNSQK